MGRAKKKPLPWQTFWRKLRDAPARRKKRGAIDTTSMAPLGGRPRAGEGIAAVHGYNAMLANPFPRFCVTPKKLGAGRE
jgi:hypothetical protein